jgi:CheY-like chemotaxis protein
MMLRTGTKYALGGLAKEYEIVMDIQTKDETHLNVLVVDDNVDAADSLETLLRMWGYHASVAYSGHDALEVVAADVPDCIFLDINMPVMDGYAVAEKIRQRPAMQGVKLVALTAYSDPEHINRMAQVGFNYYLNKSCSRSDIRRILEIYGANRPNPALID